MGVRGPGQRVVVDAWSRLICAGWVPQDRVFGGNGTAGLVIERGRVFGDDCRSRTGLLIARGRVVPHAAGSGWLTPTVSMGGYSGSMARDQHQPASSRATATLAITGRFRRSV